jgi:long-chain acyl-CoA synthetase
MESKRLFDALTNQAAENPNQQFLSAKEGVTGSKKWRHYTFQEVQEHSNKVSQLLIQQGLQKDDKIAIIAENRPEWNFTDIGAMQIGVIPVPMYPNISENDYAFIFNDAAIQYAFVGNAEIYNKVKNLYTKVPSLKGIFCFDAIEDLQALYSILPNEINEDEINKRKEQVNAEDLATIIYTSGTTGNPKGVMLTHNNIVSNIDGVRQVTPFDPGKRTLSFLPLCHSFERMVFYAYLAFGMHIHYAENLETIGENLKEIKPFTFTTVPRLLEKVYEKIMAKGVELTGFKKKLFFWAIDLGLQYKIGESNGLWYSLKLNIARKLVFSKWREALGGEVDFIVTGAAAMQPRLITLFSAAGIQVIEGYGLTETSPVLCVNRIEEEGRCIGTVGMPIPGVEIKMAEDGEILAKGKNVMKGYYSRPDLTAEVISADGWFHTGDIGIWLEHNGKQFLKITDRKKELFKTAGGKYIAPQVIENKMKECPFIEQMMVVGGDDKKFIAALIVPSFVQLSAWAKEHELTFNSNNELITLPKTIAFMEQEAEKLNPNFGHWEQIKKTKLLPDEWSVETGELTPTMKPKRKVIYEKYAKEIEAIFR